MFNTVNPDYVILRGNVQRTSAMIKNVYLWDNGMIMVFDNYGEQMQEYQGPLNMIHKILRDAPDTAKFHRGSWRAGAVEIPRDSIEFMAKYIKKRP